VSSEACVECPRNSNTSGPGSVSEADCQCSAGFEAVHVDGGMTCQCRPGTMPNVFFNACERCPLGMYKNETSNSQCTPCPQGAQATSEQDGSIYASQCRCVTGLFMNADLECEPCPRNGKATNCTSTDVFLETLPVRAGYWRLTSMSTDVRQCWKEHACLATRHVSQTCENGYIGPYCDVCANHHYLSARKCVRCTGSSELGWLSLIGLIAAMACALLVFLYCLLRMDSISDPDELTRPIFRCAA
jgi:hypothetical protein